MTILAETHGASSTITTSIEEVLKGLLHLKAGPEGKLFEAMAYSALGGGKCLRPLIVDASARMFDVPVTYRRRVGAAIEMIHAYSLVHDDLPAMDNDELRRGKPTCHLAFDEATAILAGDALLTLPFEVLSSPETHPDSGVRSELVAALALHAGRSGMVAGQMIDIECEHVAVDIDTAERLARLKTGSLFAFSSSAGAILGQAGDDAKKALQAFGSDLGLVFQIVDDILDVEGDETTLGKKAGKDAEAGKATFVGLLGLDGARQEAERTATGALDRLDMFGERAESLREITSFILSRNH